MEIILCGILTILYLQYKQLKELERKADLDRQISEKEREIKNHEDLIIFLKDPNNFHSIYSFEDYSRMSDCEISPDETTKRVIEYNQNVIREILKEIKELKKQY